MAKPEWGSKRTGPCGTKFYDFNKNPIICPNCGGEVITKGEQTKLSKSVVKETPKDISQENLKENNDAIEEVLENNILDDELIDEEVNLVETVENDIKLSENGKDELQDAIHDDHSIDIHDDESIDVEDNEDKISN